MKIEITFTEPLLGTVSGNKEIAEEFIMSKHPDGIQEDEQNSLPEQIEKSTTYFARINDDNTPILWDYQIKGFFKDACSMLRRVKGTKSASLQAYKKVVDGLFFPTPRQIPINVAGELTFTERPLRGQTAQGERIALARSETAPAGSSIEVDIVCLEPSIEKKYLKEWLDYGALRGLGQWRNSGCGRFTYLIIK
jgi:hypothetical protein